MRWRTRCRRIATWSRARPPGLRSSSSDGNMGMRIEPLTCAIGAELSGISLADAVHDDGLFQDLRALLVRHKVLFLRDQRISAAEHVAFARRFGELEDHPVAG